MAEFNFIKEISLAIAGEAGQGIETVTQIISEAAKKSNLNVFYTKEYMSRIKGGCNSSSIRVSCDKVCAYKESLDFVFAISKDSLNHMKNRFSQNTVIIYEWENQEVLEKFPNSIKVEFSLIAKEFGSDIFVNSIVSGIISGILNIDSKILEEQLKKMFSGKGEEIIKKNIQAAKKGYKTGQNIIQQKNININLAHNDSISNEIFISGNDATALGCIAGGMDFISAYPMSPSTGLLTFMEKNSQDFNILVEQVEDEIAAINMALGAWYAGGRAMVSTSGGGFALMCEAVSLSGIIETPIVIYIAQRPGPATGLPTRTEQGDLNLALYSGHGDFARIILTPGTLEDCFYLGQKAFDLADKFQIPVFILSDQYLVDSCYNIASFNMEPLEINECIVQTTADYKRYAFADNGISPRGIPGHGEGLVVIDSDEHDEEGHITEDFDVRIKMVEKRMKKFDSIISEFEEPEFLGEANAKNLVVCWGSTCNAVKEALCNINNPDISFLYFKQVYPLNKNVAGYFQNKENIICVENNYKGQFANLLKLELDILVNKKILKYNGMPFSVEELISKINEAIK